MPKREMSRARPAKVDEIFRKASTPAGLFRPLPRAHFFGTAPSVDYPLQFIIDKNVMFFFSGLIFSFFHV